MVTAQPGCVCNCSSQVAKEQVSDNASQGNSNPRYCDNWVPSRPLNGSSSKSRIEIPHDGVLDGVLYGVLDGALDGVSDGATDGAVETDGATDGARVSHSEELDFDPLPLLEDFELGLFVENSDDDLEPLLPLPFVLNPSQPLPFDLKESDFVPLPLKLDSAAPLSSTQRSPRKICSRGSVAALRIVLKSKTRAVKQRRDNVEKCMASEVGV